MPEPEMKVLLHCCVVEEHCDIVPFLYALMRAKKIGMSELSLLHFDAHPDLMPVAHPYVFNNTRSTEKLIDILSEPGGISEFILPLFYNGFVNNMCWVRSDWSHQLKDGVYEFKIGEANSRAVTTLASSYYFDEGLVYDEIDLSDIATVSLTVCTSSSSSIVFPSQAWILDICLDFFSTANPFIKELEELLISEGFEPVDLHVIKEICMNLEYKNEESLLNNTVFLHLYYTLHQ